MEQGKELPILSYLEHNAQATQRELSQYMGLSLGTINLIMKRLIRVGLVKVERLQPNSMKYILTPKGLASRIQRTYNYILRTHKEISLLKENITLAISYIISSYDIDHLQFFGPVDDLYLIIEDLSSQFSIPVSLTSSIPHITSTPILIWDPTSQQQLKDHNLQGINFLEKVKVPKAPPPVN